jgi:hypothetical protein
MQVVLTPQCTREYPLNLTEIIVYNHFLTVSILPLPCAGQAQTCLGRHGAYEAPVEQRSDAMMSRGELSLPCKVMQCCVTFTHNSENINPLAPSDPYMGRTAQLTSRRCILNTYSNKYPY